MIFYFDNGIQVFFIVYAMRRRAKNKRLAKHGLLACKRSHFARRLTVFCKLKDRVLQFPE